MSVQVSIQVSVQQVYTSVCTSLYKSEILAGAERAAKAPAFIGNMGFCPLQEKCDCGIEKCYFVVAYTPGAINMNTLTPPIALQPGFSLVSQVKLFSYSALRTLQHPVPLLNACFNYPKDKMDATDPNQCYRWKMGLSLGLPAPDKVLNPATHPTMLSVIQPASVDNDGASCNEIKLSIDFDQAVKLALKAFTEVLAPSIKRHMETAVRNVILPAVKRIKSALANGYGITTKSDMKYKNKYFAIIGTHSSGSTIIVLIRQNNDKKVAVMVGTSVTPEGSSKMMSSLSKKNPFAKILMLSNMELVVLAGTDQMQFSPGVGFPGSFHDSIRSVRGTGVCVHGIVDALDPTKCEKNTLCRLFGVKPSWGDSIVPNHRVIKGCFTTKGMEASIGIPLQRISHMVCLVDMETAFKIRKGQSHMSATVGL